uniref:Uncharacterized protein n=1 Tax=Cacopsylla melanoneura TaxID=428564 RepID=A0A8D8PTZ8_9HEMI
MSLRGGWISLPWTGLYSLTRLMILRNTFTEWVVLHVARGAVVMRYSFSDPRSWGSSDILNRPRYHSTSLSSPGAKYPTFSFSWRSSSRRTISSTCPERKHSKRT